MAFATGTQTQSRAEIDVAPLIDVLLVLLIICLVTRPEAAVGLGGADHTGAKRGGTLSLRPILCC